MLDQLVQFVAVAGLIGTIVIMSISDNSDATEEYNIEPRETTIYVNNTYIIYSETNQTLTIERDQTK